MKAIYLYYRNVYGTKLDRVVSYYERRPAL